jgi:hypothetical protein
MNSTIPEKPIILFYWQQSKKPVKPALLIGGERGIRTLDRVAPVLAFQASALDQLCDLSVSWMDVLYRKG